MLELKVFFMKIVIGSTNKTKVEAVKNIFTNWTVIAKSVPSGVSPQPIGDEETLQGAMNRAKAAQASERGSVGIGLEGGVMYIQNELYLCNWGALVDTNGTIYTASGARIKLPPSFQDDINRGCELSDIMNEYTKRHDIRFHEGAIGIFTNHLVLRAEMFSHVVKLLKGQMEYWQGMKDKHE